MGYLAATAILSNEPPRLDPGIDRAAHAQEYKRRGRVHIENVLKQSSAERIYSSLKNETRYDLCLNTERGACALRDLTPAERQECTHLAWQRAALSGFQFLFDMHLLTLNGEAYADPKHYWAKVTQFLNGPEFLGLARDVTGLESIDFADAQATLYRGGHFLTAHDDNTAGVNRLAAYVLSFTPEWRAEWGGLLEFPSAGGHIEAGYVPTFNSLKIFRVPMLHYVSAVAPYAPSGRYSITGWFRTH